MNVPAHMFKALKQFMAKDHQLHNVGSDPKPYDMKSGKPYQVVRFHFAQMAINEELIKHDEMEGILDLMMFTLSDWEIVEISVTASLAASMGKPNLAKQAYVLLFKTCLERVARLTKDFNRFANMI